MLKISQHVPCLFLEVDYRLDICQLFWLYNDSTDVFSRSGQKCLCGGWHRYKVTLWDSNTSKPQFLPPRYQLACHIFWTVQGELKHETDYLNKIRVGKLRGDAISVSRPHSVLIHESLVACPSTFVKVGNEKNFYWTLVGNRGQTRACWLSAALWC